MLMQSYMAALACNDERVRKVLQRELLMGTANRPKSGVCFASRPVPAALEMRENYCSQSVNDLYFNSVSDEQQLFGKLLLACKEQEGEDDDGRNTQFGELESERQLTRSSGASMFFSPRLESPSSSFNLRQDQQDLEVACEAIKQKTVLRCKDGTVIVNGSQSPMFIPKLDLHRITDNREMYQPLPLARRAVLSQNDEVFKCLMTDKADKLQKAEQEAMANPTLSLCWSTQSNLNFACSDAVCYTESNSDLDSCYQMEAFEKPDADKPRDKPRRRRTFTFKCVESILDKVCRLDSALDTGLLDQSGEDVIQSITLSRSKSYQCCLSDVGFQN
eukprot:TRINITY_DN1261_c0_g1_i14.p2 TRINITY_DN1261_c0_g1~~TRINITY_DN1261_c0_g1_i14.p2  ORF type:complete len:332 (-),score=38.98 TRINITY_DN1261_c0_g1_i14:2419-3414(-)